MEKSDNFAHKKRAHLSQRERVWCVDSCYNMQNNPLDIWHGICLYKGRERVKTDEAKKRETLNHKNHKGGKNEKV
ncbi:hypothetical protein DRQ18_03205 [bacterium]|nr:MAG: hypothetical protein DRQ18_03205 [bacterium]